MAPHAETTGSAPSESISHTLAKPAEAKEATKGAPSSPLSQQSIANQLSGLFEDNIVAKIVKVATNGLIDNVWYAFLPAVANSS